MHQIASRPRDQRLPPVLNIIAIAGFAASLFTRSLDPLLPQVADESQFETTVGTAVKELFADAAGGRSVTTASVKAKLEKAQQQMPKK